MGCKMKLYKLHFISSHSESQDSEFLDAEEFAQLYFIVEDSRKLAYFYGKKNKDVQFPDAVTIRKKHCES